MREQPAQVLTSKLRQRLARRHEGVRTTSPLAQRLMQMPAARHDVGQLRPAHEACVIALAPAALLHGAAEQHHGVGRCEPDLRMEGELALAWAKLDLDRA